MFSRRIASTENSSPRRTLLKGLLWFAIAALLVFVAGALYWLIRLDNQIQLRFSQKRFAAPIEFYSSPESVHKGQIYSSQHLLEQLQRKLFSRREFGQSMASGDFALWSREQCLQSFQAAPKPGEKVLELPTPDASLENCVAFVNHSQAADTIQLIALDASGHVLDTYAVGNNNIGASGNIAPISVTTWASIEPELFAQYYGDKPVLRDLASIAKGDVPPMCLNSILAIEDAHFLDHGGISVTGLLRSFLRDLRTGQAAQGGSTITQQLVKNYFLTNEKTMSRKLTEIAMAFLVERHISKDEILETYINLIYMGQNGPFEVRGFAAASQHYFAKPLRELNLPECALLAAVLNSPGFFDPSTHAERALKRRALVLDRLTELGYITGDQAKDAKATPLPAKPERSLTEPAPYYVQAVRREVDSLKLDKSEGLKIITALDLGAQEAAQQAVRSGLDKLETQIPRLKKLKATGHQLEAALVSADPNTGAIQALVGGRGYQATQFNRIFDSHRQVGSVMKPIVYLTALERTTTDGKPYTPMTIVNDVETTHRFAGQEWTPKNYEGVFNGPVAAYWALKESLNAATANLALDIGLDNIVETARRLGIKSPLQPLPSLALGAFELAPIEVLQAYSTMATMGQMIPLHLIERVEDLNGQELYHAQAPPSQAVAPDTMAVLVGMLEQVIASGTGHQAKLMGFTRIAAGKTGTTNEKKDAWFAGFTPDHAAVVWVGYDDNTSHGLTGAFGAVPIWTEYMKAKTAGDAEHDFIWPKDVVVRHVDAGGPTGSSESSGADLVFKKGQEP